MKYNYLDNTIKLMQQAFEIHNLQQTEEYKRLEKLQEKRRKNK